MIVFIGCGKKKNYCRCKAEKMYIGTFFQTCLSYAKTLTDNIYILSAKYGILNLYDVIEPYDRTLNTMSKQDKEEWKEMVKGQIQSRNIVDDDIVFLCGKNYYEPLMDIFPNASTPLADLHGMGYQIQLMKNKMKRRLFL